MKLTNVALFFLAASAGCGLFDTSSTPTTDASTDAGVIAFNGALCVLSDYRDYRTCTVVAKANVSIVVYLNLTTTVIATTTTTATGQFTLAIPASDLGLSVLVYANDPTLQYFASLGRTTVVAGADIAVPLVTTQNVEDAALAVGVPLNGLLGISFAYMVNASGVPESGVRGGTYSTALGPFYDGATANTLNATTMTSTNGLIAYFNVPLGLATFPISSPLATTYQSTIAMNAITFNEFPLTE
jgi:hypothetical protein